jgi:ribonuclease E
MSEPMPSDAVLPSEPPAESTSTGGSEVAREVGDGASSTAARKKRRRGSRGGRNRQRSNADAANRGPQDDEDDDVPELPDRPMEGQIHDPEVAERVLVPRKPQIGDTMPAPARPAADATAPETAARRRRRRGGRGRGSGAKPGQPVTADLGDSAFEVDEETLARQRGRERKGRPIGRYLMCVHVRPGATQIAVLEGRSLIEHYVSKPADDPTQIHGNIYLGRVQNVLPGMEAAFVDIGTPKNAVLYRGDLQYDQEDIVEKGANARIEQILKARQTIVCQVTKNPIGAKGARLTQEVSLPGRSVVLIPNSSTYGISKRLNDDERKRLRGILDRVKPAQHGVIVRTAAEGISTDEIERDVARLVSQWEQIEALAKRSAAPSLLYTEPSMAVRVIREEFNREYRGVAIDDPVLFEAVRDYVASISPALADRVEYYDPVAEGLPLFERHHVHEQLHKALDRKVWLPSGGSLIIEHTEALTVIDVNTGKNVGTSSLEETVFRNNLEAAEEIARQLRLRDIGGIIVIDFIDMEIRENRHAVIAAFRDALARDKTRTQVFDISDLGLVEMTRKRIGEGLLESFAATCPYCEGRGVLVDHDLIE